MPRIPIISDKKDTSIPSHVPKSAELHTRQDRYRPTGKPPLPVTSSFSPQAKSQKENR